MATPPIITVMSRAAERAARSLMRDFYEVESLQSSVKGPNEFVTAAYRRAEEIIQEELSGAKPNFGFMMAQSKDIEGKIDSKFIVDPLGGSLNFLHGIPHWCISIAQEENGKITAGMVLDPIKDEMFFATSGSGSWMRGNKRLRVSGRKNLNISIVATCDNPLGVNTNRYKNVQSQAAGMRDFGVTALDMAYVAAGRHDGFFGGSPNRGPNPWETAAGTLLVREAGGMASEINGQANAIYNKNVLAGNEYIYSELKEILNAK